MKVDHLKVKGIGWEGTEPTACCEHSNELACCIIGREFDMKLSSINFTGKAVFHGVVSSDSENSGCNLKHSWTIISFDECASNSLS
jgi:hypothetical protein